MTELVEFHVRRLGEPPRRRADPRQHGAPAFAPGRQLLDQRPRRGGVVPPVVLEGGGGQVVGHVEELLEHGRDLGEVVVATTHAGNVVETESGLDAGLE